MKEELQQRLIDSADKIQQWIESTEAFLTEQTPLLVQEVLLYHTFLYGSSMAASLVLFVILLWSAKKMTQNKKRSEEPEFDFGAFIFVLLGVLASFISFFVFLVKLTKVLVAPRLFILEYVGGLIS